MAGNIIHAIATTNALVAGLIVTEACKILSTCKRYIKESFVGKYALIGQMKRTRDILIKSMKPPSGNPSCVCCGKSILHIKLDSTRMILEEFLAKVNTCLTMLGV